MGYHTTVANVAAQGILDTPGRVSQSAVSCREFSGDVIPVRLQACARAAIHGDAPDIFGADMRQKELVMSAKGKFVPFFDGKPSITEKRQMKKGRRRVERRRSKPYLLMKEFEKEKEMEQRELEQVLRDQWYQMEMELEMGDDFCDDDYERVDDIAALLRHFQMERDIQEEQEWVDLLALND